MSSGKPSINSFKQHVKHQVMTLQEYSSKNSCEPSLNHITPNCKSQNYVSSKQIRQGKQPLFSMVPQNIHKNLNSNVNGKPVITHINHHPLFSQPDEERKTRVMYCEESEIMRSHTDPRIHQMSNVTLTPQKQLP